jgi:hypothetical protein
MTTTTTTAAAEAIAVLSHPLRIRALFTMEASEEGVSPKELAAAFEVPLANIAYHVVVMRKARVIDLKRHVPRRGAVEHYYVLSPKGKELAGAARTLGYGDDA